MIAPMMKSSFFEKMTWSVPAVEMRGALALPIVGPDFPLGDIGASSAMRVCECPEATAACKKWMLRESAPRKGIVRYHPLIIHRTNALQVM